MKNIRINQMYAHESATICLKLLNNPEIRTLFILNEDDQMVGTVTDGDIRRGLLSGLNISNSISDFMFKDFISISDSFSLEDIKTLKANGVDLVPVLNQDKKIIRIVDLSKKKSLLPVDVVLMAGGEGRRLRPLTDNTPKPLLKVGGKALIDYNLQRFSDFGIENVNISINYLAKKVVDHVNELDHGLYVNFIHEEKSLGTIGCLNLLSSIKNEYILLMNADILTTLDFEDFFLDFIQKGSDFSVASISYNVNVPYGILEIHKDDVLTLKEKPTYKYQANAGIYLMKKEVLQHLGKQDFYNATDFMLDLIKLGKKVSYYNIVDYWLDIGKIDDFEKAQTDILHLKM